MDFIEVLAQVRKLLQEHERVTYRVLKRQFALDDESLEDLKEQLIEAEELAIDKDGKMLVWAGAGKNTRQQSSTAQSQPPISYTPQHLVERIRAEQAAMESRGSANGERKTITALFADLKGSTALIEGLDPEDARAIIDPALQIMMDAVHRYDGYVAQALGDGTFALFGAPIAHEDHPQRALYAALRMQEEMRGYSDQVRLKHGVPLHMRVGVNTGEVVVRSIRKDDLHADYVPVGHSTNLAARMEQLATPGSIVISEHTRKLTEGYFELKALGAAAIKGVEEPLNVYEVLGAGPLRTRLQVSARRGLTRFVGHHSELDQLQHALEQAKAGHGQIVGVMGEPGLGKSRLFYEFKLTLHSGCLVLAAFAVSHGKASPYLPLVELLKHYFHIEPTDDEQARQEKVAGKVLILDRSLAQTLPYLFSLLGIDDPDSRLHQMDTHIRRQRTFDALKKLFLRESLNQPLVLLFEDLHWLDTETQGFLDVLSESVASATLLLLTNYRPEYRHEWGHKTYYTQVRLAPLGRTEAEQLLTFLLGADPSLTSVQALVLEKTQGTPFFMEEVVQTLAEQGVLLGDRGNYRLAQAPTALQLPSTVQAILAARIDRLAPDEKALLQQLAVIGRAFRVSLIRHVITQPEDDLYRLLASLQRKEFLYEQSAFPEVAYIFKHALTQEVAYGTVLHEQRKRLHERTGQALESVYAATLPEHYSDLAHHYRRSANTQKAIAYLHKASQQAVQQAASSAALSQLSAALELLLTCPETRERDAQELTLRLAVGPTFYAAQGTSAPAVLQHYTRARALCDQLGDIPQRVSVLYGLLSFHVTRGELQAAQALAEESLQLAEQTNEAAVLLQAHFAAGNTYLWRGEIVHARVLLEQGVASSQPQAPPLLPGGMSPMTTSFALTALALWCLGYPEQALRRSDEALHLAQELGQPYSLASAFTWTALLHLWRGNGRVAQERADASVALCDEHGFPVYLAWSTILRGETLIAQAQSAEGIAQVRQGLLETQAAELYWTMYLAWLAEGYGGAGQVEEGLATLAEALRLVEKNDERFYEAEVYRVKGELLLTQEIKGQKPVLSVVEGSKGQSQNSEIPDPQSQILDPESEAETCFLKAIEIAQKQQAKSFELRGTMSLAQLWWQQGKIAEARQMLAEIYGWFTEGFDTKDLQEAKALLATLSEGR